MFLLDGFAINFPSITPPNAESYTMPDEPDNFIDVVYSNSAIVVVHFYKHHKLIRSAVYKTADKLDELINSEIRDIYGDVYA